MAKQRSAEWFGARVGMVTASRISHVVASGRNGQFSISRRKYQDDLVEERLTGQPSPTPYVNEHMEWGIANEAIARRAYGKLQGLTVEETGFVAHPQIHWSGASPDGLVGRTGLVEIKCPSTQAHLKCCDRGHVPTKYIFQMQWQLACTGRDWCDFVSFDPRAPRAQKLFIHRVSADTEVIEWLELEVKTFLLEVELRLKQDRRHRKTDAVEPDDARRKAKRATAGRSGAR